MCITEKIKKTFLTANEIIILVLGGVLVFVTLLIYLMFDRYAIAVEHIAVLEQENEELSMIITSYTQKDYAEEVINKIHQEYENKKNK